MIEIFSFSILIFLLILSGLGGSKKGNSENSYLFANRKIGFFALTATLVMTEFNTSTLIAFSSMGYSAGFWALVLPFVFLLALIFYSYVVASKWKRFNGLSVAQFFSKRYGVTVGKTASLSLLLAMAGFSAVYVKSMTILFSLLLPSVPFYLLSMLLTLLVLLMTLRGGLIAIIRTDIASFCFLSIFLPVLLYYAWIEASRPTTNEIASSFSLESSFSSLPPSFVSAILFLTIFTYILAPWYAQKIFAARSEKVAKKSVFFAGVLVFLFYGLAVLSSSFLSLNKNVSLASPDQALPYLIQNSLPKGFMGIGYALFFATAATTLSGVWNAMTSMFIGDFLSFKKKGKVFRAGYLTLFFSFLSYVLANTIQEEIFNKLILANIPILALSFALLGGFYWKKTSKTGALASIVVGVFWGIATYFYFGERGAYQWYWVIYGIPLIFSTGILGSCLFPKNDK
jgi:solute:Na+ symporter, SSS family